MRRSLAIWVSVLVLLVSGCTSLTEEDLADLQSPNSMIKKEAINRIARGPGFPNKFMGPLLQRNNEEEAVSILIEFLDSKDELEDEQINILKALLRLCQTTKVPSSPLIEKLDEKQPRIRRKVIEVLAKSKSREALPAMVKLLGEEKNKYVIIWALGEIGDPAAIPLLNRLLASADK
ncbi:MAG: HEAT repeat domain-containing protein, partial [Deltaproteobacteria bacterium]|nr:HEAT repeat domain-containing protein [Deltaproteobacteria bacterium]